MYNKAHLKDRTLKTKFLNFRIDILNSDFSVDIASSCTKFLGYVPHSPPVR